MQLSAALSLFVGTALVALVAAQGRLPAVFTLAKPAATLSLLLVTGLPTNAGLFPQLMVAGILLSALGDAALLHDGRGFFLAGLGLFLLAHVGYTVAFLAGGGAAPIVSTALLGAAVFLASTAWLLRRIWAGVDPALRAPVAVYGLAITLMVASAYLVLGGPWPARVGELVAAGAVLFYVSDALLAWSLFHARFPQHQTINLVFYWAGQAGLAVATRLYIEGGA